MKTAHDQAREHGGCGEIINVNAFCDGDAVPSTAGLCDSPAKHRQHVTELSTAEAAVVQRFEAAADAEESFDATAALRRVVALLDNLDADVSKCRTYAAQARIDFDLASEASYAMQAANLDTVSVRLHAAIRGDA